MPPEKTFTQNVRLTLLWYSLLSNIGPSSLPIPRTKVQNVGQINSKCNPILIYINLIYQSKKQWVQVHLQKEFGMKTSLTRLLGASQSQIRGWKAIQWLIPAKSCCCSYGPRATWWSTTRGQELSLSVDTKIRRDTSSKSGNPVGDTARVKREQEIWFSPSCDSIANVSSSINLTGSWERDWEI